jgi:UDP-N-acetylmuramyl pentapeptide phosphotransferase/UDP-N-acetylglucosamine-1-phosphate transferase
MIGRTVALASHFAWIVVIAAGASAGTILLLKPALARYALARPNARSSHTRPTPQGGGIAVLVATFAAVLLATTFSAIEPSAVAALWSLAAAVALLAVTGALDDIFHVPVVYRLPLQFVAVGMVLAMLPVEARVVPLLPWWLERAALLIGGVYFVNLVNFMDGIDWMTVAEVVPVTGALALLTFTGALTPRDGLIAVALFGAIIGFAPFNRPVAKLFLGDVGSLPIGLLLFWLLLQLATRGHLTAALLLPLYYVADATITLARRIANGEMITQAHRTHFYQRATNVGFSVPAIVTRVFAVNVALAALAIGSVSAASRWINLTALALGGVLVAGLLLHFTRARR